MATEPNSFVRLAFGPFELDAGAGELRKRGIRVRLSTQPLQILLVLLAHPGELVTREELRQSVWTDGIFVDFEGGLNAAMAKLRRSLGDSAGNPRYIETVPGRGYRFIGTLRELSRIEAPAVDQPQTTVVKIAPEPSVPGRDSAKGSRAVRRWWIAGVGCVGAIAVATTVYLYLHRPPVLGEKGNIMLANFVNSTGDPVFDETLRQGLAVQLQESPFLSIVSEERIQHTLALMGQPAGARLTPALAGEVCERTASAAFVEGSIAPLGTQYVLGVTAKRCGGDIVDEEQVQAAKKEDVLNALTQIARKFLKRAGESIAAIRKHDRPLAEATTSSLEALKAYSAAWNAAFQTGVTAAVPLLQRAIDLDPQFAMAHAFLGRVYADIGESVLSAESTKRAYALRDRASDHERFFITFSYYRQITGDLARAQQTLELWAQTYPRDSAPHSLLSGYTTLGTGQFEKTIAEAEKAIALDPDTTPAYLNLADANLALGRIDEAENSINRAAARKLEIADSLVFRYQIAFLRNDKAGMDREVARAKDKPGAEDWLLHLQAAVAADSGHLGKARALSDRAINLARGEGEEERAAIYQAGAAVWESLFGDGTAAKTDATAALRISNARDVEYGAGLAFAFAGDSTRSRALADDLYRRFPDDTFIKFSYEPTLRALYELRSRTVTGAFAALQPAIPYEFALPWTRLYGCFGSLYPAYLRGNAYLAAHRGSEAARQFEAVLNHPGIVLTDPVAAMTRLQLARAFALEGDYARAKLAYSDFLNLWTDADPDVPVLIQAKSEYAKLQ